MTKRLSRVFRFAEPIVHGSLIRQILVALVLGAALAFVWPIPSGPQPSIPTIRPSCRSPPSSTNMST